VEPKGAFFLMSFDFRQPAQVFDPFVTEDLGNFLFKDDKDDFGQDLIARNIQVIIVLKFNFLPFINILNSWIFQRGRDHGLPAYNEFRKFCGYPSLPRDFSSLPSAPRFRNDTWAQLRRLYASPADIDLFTGGLAEIRESGSRNNEHFNLSI